MNPTPEPNPECVQNENPQDRLLMDAIKSGDGISGFMELLAAGANVNAKLSEQGITYGFKIENESALHLAARFRGEQPEYTRLLLEYGADVHSLNIKGQTPLFQACIESAEDVCTLLIQSGSKIDAKDKNGCVPLNLMLGRFDAAAFHRLTQAMDNSQVQCALDVLKETIRKPNESLVFYVISGQSVPDRSESAQAMLQSRQARLAMELLLVAIGTVKPGAAPCARMTQP